MITLSEELYSSGCGYLKAFLEGHQENWWQEMRGPSKVAEDSQPSIDGDLRRDGMETQACTSIDMLSAQHVAGR